MLLRLLTKELFTLGEVHVKMLDAHIYLSACACVHVCWCARLSMNSNCAFLLYQKSERTAQKGQRPQDQKAERVGGSISVPFLTKEKVALNGVTLSPSCRADCDQGLISAAAPPSPSPCLHHSLSLCLWDTHASVCQSSTACLSPVRAASLGSLNFSQRKG